MPKGSINIINENKDSDEMDSSELDSNNSQIKEKAMLSSLNKSLSLVSNSKNISNLPLVEKSTSELNFQYLNSNRDEIWFKNYENEFSKKMKSSGLDKSISSNFLSRETNEITDKNLVESNNRIKKKDKLFIEEKDNYVDRPINNFTSLRSLAEIKKGNVKNLNNYWNNIPKINNNTPKDNPFTVNKNNKSDSNENNLNTLSSNIITQQPQPNPVSKHLPFRKLSKEFYSSFYLKPNLIGERLKNDVDPNLILFSPNNDEDFNLNFAFNNLNYGNLNKEFQVKIIEEKIKARQGSAKLRSMRTFKSDDPLIDLKNKFKEEREMLEKARIEEKVAQLKAEQEKTVNRNLITFAEQKLKKILRALDILIIFLVISDVSITIYSNHRLTSNQFDLNQRLIKEKLELDSEIINLRWIMIVIICLIEILLLIKYFYRIKLMRLRRLASAKDTIFSSNLYKRLLVEMLVLALFTPPHDNSIITGKMHSGEFTYSIDSIIMLLKLVKLYYLFLFISRFSIWMSRRTHEIARRMKAAVKYNFTLKAGLKSNPFLLMLFGFFFITILLGIIIKVCEYNFTRDAEKARDKNFTQKNNENPFFQSYYDVIWLVVITMVTVGYGDIYPETHIGRIICFIASIIGMIFVSLMIVRLGSLVELRTHENKAYHAIQMNVALNRIEIKAKNLIKALFKLKMIKMKKKETFSNGTKLSHFLSELLFTKQKIREFYFAMKSKTSHSLYLEDIINHFSRKIDNDLNNLGFLKYVGEDMVDLIGKINKSHMQIYQSLDLLKAKQNNVSRFIVEMNNKVRMKKITNKKPRETDIINEEE